MKDKTLLMIAMIVSLVGLSILSIYAQRASPALSNISTVMECTLPEGTVVSLKGEVKSINVRGNISMMSISQQSSIDLVAFERLDINKGQIIRVEGKVEDYNGRREILVSKIIKAK